MRAARYQLVGVTTVVTLQVVLFLTFGNPLALFVGAVFAVVGAQEWRKLRVTARRPGGRSPEERYRQRNADIDWWRHALRTGTPTERLIAPQILSALGDTEPMAGPISASEVPSASEPTGPPAAVLERAAALTEGDPSVEDLRAAAGTWEVMVAHTADPFLRGALRVDIAAARHLQAEAERVRAEAQAMVRKRVGEMQRSAIRRPWREDDREWGRLS